MVKTFNPFDNTTTTKVNNIKSTIANELFNRYGFITTDFKPSKSSIKETIFAPNKFKFFNDLINKFFSKGKIVEPLIYAKTLVEDSRPHSERNLESAMMVLKNYANLIKNTKSKDYDYKIAGIPVKWYDKFVQVGSYIIPYNDYDEYFKTMKNNKSKETIINLILTVSNNINITQIAA